MYGINDTWQDASEASTLLDKTYLEWICKRPLAVVLVLALRHAKCKRALIHVPYAGNIIYLTRSSSLSDEPPFIDLR